MVVKQKKIQKLKPSGASSVVNGKDDDDDSSVYRNITTKHGIRYDNVEVAGNDDGRPAMSQTVPPTVMQRRNNADEALSRYVCFA